MVGRYRLIPLRVSSFIIPFYIPEEGEQDGVEPDLHSAAR